MRDNKHARAKRKERRRRERREESVCLCDIFIPELKACTASGVGPMQLPTLDNQVYDVWFSKHGVVEFCFVCGRFLQLHIFCGNEVNIPLRLEIFSPLEQQTFSVCTAVSGFRPLLVHL